MLFVEKFANVGKRRKLTISLFLRINSFSPSVSSFYFFLHLKSLLGSHSFKNIFRFIYFSVHEFFACTLVCIPCMCLMSVGVKRGGWVPGIGAEDGREPPCGCREPNLGLL